MTAPIFDAEIPCTADDCEAGVIVTEHDTWDWSTERHGTAIDTKRCDVCKGAGTLEWCYLDQQPLDDCDDIACCVSMMQAIDESTKADEAIFRASRAS